MEQNKVYQNLSKLWVKDKVEKKGRFDYLSWGWAWHYLQSNYPGSQRVVYETAEGVPYFTDGKFANVKVGIIVNGVEQRVATIMHFWLRRSLLGACPIRCIPC